MSSLSECIPWMTVGLADCIAIVILNLCTIIVFIRNRNLRKRSTYLVINLAVIDMFVGLAVGCHRFSFLGISCNLRNWLSTDISILAEVLVSFFVFGSLTNITIIALERVHATFYPFKHRVLKKWVYRLIIAIVWVTSGLVTISYTLLVHFNKFYYVLCFRITFPSICLLIICVSYTSIVIKVRCGAQPQHHGATSRERRLTMTLLIVTVVSLLFYLPYVILNSAIEISKSAILESLSISVSYHLRNALFVLFYSNPLVNPILYAIRMPEYRSALLACFSKRPQQQRQVAVFPLRDM